MNKTELVAAMAEQTNLSKKDAEAALKAFIDVVSEELKKGEKVQLVGFGTFEVSERAAREGRNPQTGETMGRRPGICRGVFPACLGYGNPGCCFYRKNQYPRLSWKNGCDHSDQHK